MTAATPAPAPPPPPLPEADTPSVAGEEDPGAALDDESPADDGTAAEDGDSQGVSGASRRPRSEPQRRA